MIWRLREGLVEFVNQVAIRQCTGQLKYCYEYQAVQPSATLFCHVFIYFHLFSSQMFSKLAVTHAKVHCIFRKTLGLEWATCHHALDRSLCAASKYKTGVLGFPCGHIAACRGHDVDNGSDLQHGWCSSRSCRNWQDRDCEGHPSAASSDIETGITFECQNLLRTILC